MPETICKHYEPIKDKTCKHYSMTKTAKIGLCMLKMKNTLICHYSEKVLGIYHGDSVIVKSEEL